MLQTLLPQCFLNLFCALLFEASVWEITALLRIKDQPWSPMNRPLPPHHHCWQAKLLADFLFNCVYEDLAEEAKSNFMDLRMERDGFLHGISGKAFLSNRLNYLLLFSRESPYYYRYCAVFIRWKQLLPRSCFGK